MSYKKCNKMQDMSDRARCVRQKLQKTQDMSDKARYVRQKLQKPARYVRQS